MATSKQVRAPMRESRSKTGQLPLRPARPTAVWQEAMPQWDDWVQHLVRRKKPVPLRKLLPQTGKSALSWSLPPNIAESTRDLLRRLDRLRPKKGAKPTKGWQERTQGWLQRARQDTASLDVALQSVAWAHALPILAPRLSEPVWTDLCETLIRLGSEASDGQFPQDPLVGQVVAGELPLTLSYLLPELPSCVALSQSAREVITEGMDEMLDGEGQPHARFLSDLRMLLACWTRCLYLDRMLKKRRIGKPARLQYEWLVRQALRWTRRDGTALLSNGDRTRSHFAPMMNSAVDLAGDDADQQILEALVNDPRNGKLCDDALPSAAEHSEWAETAVLRTKWDSTSDVVALTYNDRRLRSEFVVGGKVIWSGEMQPVVSLDGRPLSPQSDWEEVCWESDYDANYIELEMELESGCRLQRQILLARADRFLLIADALNTARPGKMEIRNALPLADGVSLATAEQSHEAFLHTSKRVASVLPLSLPEWRVDRNLGTIVADRAEFTQLGQGGGLYAALFIDFEPARQRFPLTWRQLTVAESLRILTPDQAVAYRIQVGKRQWVVYRSIGPTGNRTFLGQNLTSEFLVARFDRSGELTNLIEIES